jgi:hypothetical protein
VLLNSRALWIGGNATANIDVWHDIAPVTSGSGVKTGVKTGTQLVS